MDPSTWDRIEQAFAEAVELPLEQRAAYCDRVAAGDAGFRRELGSLLAAHAAASNVLDQPPLALDEREPAAGLAEIGQRIGPWRIESLLGRGGSGEVYLARRDDGAFAQQVAIKLLRREAVEQVERFLAEREILGRLEHPSIARLVDAGTLADGRPYAVMEHVAGQTLMDWCRAREAGLAQRLALFLQITDAVAFAHQNLVVHRDLKPGNILVTGDGRVKLLDFGIAKRLDAWSDGEMTHAPFTPDYAAPEQLSGRPATTATDVFALGIILFELLTDERPWRSERLPIARIVQLIVHDEAPRPSESAHSPFVPARLLRGDLDAVVLQCLRKQPGQRYATVEALQRDIERHLAREPVAVRAHARAYVLGRLLRRHGGAAAAIGSVVLSLAVALAVTLHQAQKIRDERDIAQRAATREEALRLYLTSMFRAPAAGDASEETTAKAMLDRGAQRVLKEYRDDPRLTGKIVMTLANLYGALHDVEGEAPLLEGYLASAGPQADAESVAYARQELGHVELLRGHVDRAAALMQQAEAFWRSAPERFREQRLEGLQLLGQLQRARGDLAGSIKTYRDAITERAALSGATDREVATLHNSLAITLTEARRFDEAFAAYRQALAIFEQGGHRLDAMATLANTGALAWRVGRLKEAEQTLARASQGLRTAGGDSAAVAASLSLHGAALTTLGRHDEAARVLAGAEEVAQRFTDASSPLAIQIRLLSTELLLARGQLDAADALAQENRRRADERLGPQSLFALRVRSGQARLLLAHGDAARAHAEFIAAADGLRALGVPAELALADAELGAGEASMRLREGDRAVAEFNEALALRRQAQWPESWRVAEAKERLGEALAALGRPGSEALLAEATRTLDAQLGAKSAEAVRARTVLALHGSGR
jgi:non-specific serine/threonine protein kinase/serine/threonine-protein kinase